MADFHLWPRDSLVKFATEATAKLIEQTDEIAALRVKLMRIEVKTELAKPATPDTVTPNQSE